MTCYECGSANLVLHPLWPYDRQRYPKLGIVLRLCRNCGKEQNHMGDDETISPLVAAQEAPDA